MGERREAVVTGAGGDIGRGIALQLAQDGHDLVLLDINAATLQGSAEACRKLGVSVESRACDITRFEELQAALDPCLKRARPGVLVNNAGGVVEPSSTASTAESWQQETALNLNAAFYCIKILMPLLRQRGGHIVNIASVNGLGVFGHPGYSSAKAGLIHLTRSLAVELGPDGVHVNAVAPGTVQTQAWKDRMAANPEVFAEAARWYPLGRMARVEDIVAAVSFLIGPGAAAITGAILPVDCGLTAGVAAQAHTFTQCDDWMN